MYSRITNIYHHLANAKIEEYQEYINIMEISIENNKDNYSDFIDEATKDLTEEEKDEVIEFHFLDEYQTLANTFPLILRKSTFIALYSFAETELLQIAMRLEQKHPNDLKINEFKDKFKHNGLFLYYSYTVYILKNHQSNMIDITDELKGKFKHYNALRNYFVHDDHKNLNTENIKMLIDNLNLEIDPFDSSYTAIKGINKEFNYEFLNDIKLLLEVVYKKVDL